VALQSSFSTASRKLQLQVREEVLSLPVVGKPVELDVSRHVKSWCEYCQAMRYSIFEYQRYEDGATIIVTCMKCSKTHEIFRKWQK